MTPILRSLSHGFFLLVASLWLAAPVAAEDARPPRMTADTPVLIVTDSLPDDAEATLVIADVHRATRGRNLLFVTADDDVELKAEAWHNLLYFQGLTEATVVAGNPNVARSPIDYVQDYRRVEDMEYLRLLRSNREARPWLRRDYRATAARFVREHPGVVVLMMANPLTFNDFAAQIDPRQLRAMLTMGIWKTLGARRISAYNSNVNITAAVEFLRWQRQHGVPLYHLPSHLCTSLGEIAAAIRDPRHALFTPSGTGDIFASLLRGFNHYRDRMTDILFQRYGLQDHVKIWDPRNEIWLGDVLLALLAIQPDLSVWETDAVDIDVATRVSPAPGVPDLGFAVTAATAAPSASYNASTFDYPRASLLLQSVYREARVTPPFAPERDVVIEDTTPIGFIGKTSYDDLRALRMLIGLNRSRLQLVIAESTHTPLTARILRGVLDGSGLSRLPVVAGRAHTLEELDRVEAMRLEAHLIRSGLLSRGMLGDEERRALMATSDAALRALSAEEELQTFLERHERVDLMVTTSIDTLHAVLSRNPHLAGKIRSLHLMGGWRQARAVGDPPTEWVDGAVTRNWALSPASTESLFGILAQARVRTFVYSSHLGGGMLTETSMPQLVQSVRQLSRDVPIEGVIDALRVSWNQGLVDQGKPIDVNTNYGSPLALYMAAWLALGENAHRHFGATPGTFRFSREGSQVTFAADPAGTIFLVDRLERFPILDGTARFLTEQAARPRTFGEHVMYQWRRFRRLCTERIMGRTGGS